MTMTSEKNFLRMKKHQLNLWSYIVAVKRKKLSSRYHKNTTLCNTKLYQKKLQIANKQNWLKSDIWNSQIDLWKYLILNPKTPFHIEDFESSKFWSLIGDDTIIPQIGPLSLILNYNSKSSKWKRIEVSWSTLIQNEIKLRSWIQGMLFHP